MLTDHSKQRISFVFLCATPFVAAIAAVARPLRIPGVYHVIGGALFAAISIAACTLGAREIRADAESAIARPGGDLPGNTICARCAALGRYWILARRRNSER